MGDFTPGEREFYARHVALQEMGEGAQRRVSRARIAVVGLGGLGCPVVQLLASSGVGFLRLIDFGSVEIMSLLAENLYSFAEVGDLKAGAAKRAAERRNPFVRVEAKPCKFVADDLSDCDLVVDATNTRDTSLAIASAARLAGIPVVHGAALGTKGRIGVFWPKASPCLGCMLSMDEETCETVGALSTTASVTGALMAHEAIKAVAGVGDPLTGLLVFDAATTAFKELELASSADCKICGMGTPTTVPTISVEDLARKLASGDQFLLLDVRDQDELEISKVEPCVNVPASQVVWRSHELPSDVEICVLCKSGGRSGTIAQVLMLKGFTNVRYVDGGIDAYAERIDPKLKVY